MKVWYKIYKYIVIFYVHEREDSYTVYKYTKCGNKRIKPERILKYRYNFMGFYYISLNKFLEVKAYEKLDWFETKKNKEVEG